MPRLNSDFSRYVKERWLDTLLAILRGNPKTSRLVFTNPTSMDGADFGGDAVNAVALGQLIFKNDTEKDADRDNARSWERKIRRWVSQEHAPEPAQVRRMFRALKTNWLVALGRSGYKQHAICMLHSLYMTSSCVQATQCAHAIFDGIDVRLEPALLMRQHLDRALQSCWEDSLISPYSLPTAPIAPRELPASKRLHRAYMLLDSAIYAPHGRAHNLSLRLASVEDDVSQLVLSWAEEIAPNPPRPVPKNHMDNQKEEPK